MTSLAKYALPVREETDVRFGSVVRCTHKHAECVGSWVEREISAYTNREISTRVFRYVCPDCGGTWEQEE